VVSGQRSIALDIEGNKVAEELTEHMACGDQLSLVVDKTEDDAGDVDVRIEPLHVGANDEDEPKQHGREISTGSCICGSRNKPIRLFSIHQRRAAFVFAAIVVLCTVCTSLWMLAARIEDHGASRWWLATYHIERWLYRFM
jgi:hypothetical protein